VTEDRNNGMFPVRSKSNVRLVLGVVMCKCSISDIHNFPWILIIFVILDRVIFLIIM
jgi:hypothetical protein